MPTGIPRPKTGPLKCTRCDETKPRKEFRIRLNKGKLRPHSWCYDCELDYNRPRVAAYHARLRARR